MKVLVTGAAGFLGRHVVTQLLDKHHEVHAIVRANPAPPPKEWQCRVKITEADLETFAGLKEILTEIDVVIHLATSMRGPVEKQVHSTLASTENLLCALQQSGGRIHLILASSCSVYDWRSTGRELNEESPLTTATIADEGYSAAKLLQEQRVREFSKKSKATLTVLRPGFIYGPGAGVVGGGPIKVGPALLVPSPLSALRLTHVKNCAEAFVCAAEACVVGTFNIIDDEQVSAWRYSGKLLPSSGARFRIPIPYMAGYALASLTNTLIRRSLPKLAKKVPSALIPNQFRARFKPMKYDNSRAKFSLGWKCMPYFDARNEIA
jgi:nucleoside-diphosphate-sugar epimerase